jgi:hypothetical protein
MVHGNPISLTERQRAKRFTKKEKLIAFGEYISKMEGLVMNAHLKMVKFTELKCNLMRKVGLQASRRKKRHNDNEIFAA